MKVLYRGAEAVIFLKRNVVIKRRIRKRYRIKEIDIPLRIQRTRKEARLMEKARKVGVNVPRVLKVSEKRFEIRMEFVKGLRVKEFLLMERDRKKIAKVCFEIGKSIGKLHSNNIVHGDLTTSNMILVDDRVYFIDFGLGFHSRRIEDKGVDLNLLYEALKSVHYNILNLCWRNILKGYKKEFKDARKAIKKVYEIEKRGRYTKKS